MGQKNGANLRKQLVKLSQELQPTAPRWDFSHTRGVLPMTLPGSFSGTKQPLEPEQLHNVRDVSRVVLPGKAQYAFQT